jgi:hypothetical protein
MVLSKRESWKEISSQLPMMRSIWGKSQAAQDGKNGALLGSGDGGQATSDSDEI